MTNDDKHNIIRDLLVKEYKGKKSKWFDEFNNLSKEDRTKTLKFIHDGFFTTVVQAVHRQDQTIYLPKMGRLNIKKYRKRYLDLRNDNYSKEEAATIVKQEYYNEKVLKLEHNTISDEDKKDIL